jgi:hypothetical protein
MEYQDKDYDVYAWRKMLSSHGLEDIETEVEIEFEVDPEFEEMLNEQVVGRKKTGSN